MAKPESGNTSPKLPDGLFRLKAELVSDGLILSHAATAELPAPQRVIPASHPSRAATTCAASNHPPRLYDQAWQTAETQGAFDSLFSIQTASCSRRQKQRVRQYQGQWLTPSLDLDILNGVMRQAVLQQPQTYLGADAVIETHITRDMLERAEKIRLSNALRGVFEADLVY